MNFSGLTDLAKGKKAWLSSESKWSRPNDAWRAMDDDGQRDFSFHTGQQDNPWWLIDLEQVYRLFFIVIGNRRTLCQERAGTLTVEVSNDLQAWELVHTGQIFWDGNLTFPLMGLMSARYVKLSLRSEKTYLHLTKVEIWGTDQPDFVRSFPEDSGCLVPVPSGPEDNNKLISEGKKTWLSSADETAPIRSGSGQGLLGQEKSRPWRMIDLEDVYPLESLTLKKTADLADLSVARLKIEISRDGQRWSTIHEGCLYWTGSLHYPLRGEVLARFVKISFDAADGDNLPAMEVRTPGRRSDLQVMCLKSDGLGARLSTVTNAMYLAKILNCDVKIFWKPRDLLEYDDPSVIKVGVGSAEEIFSQEFLDRCQSQENAFNNESKLLYNRRGNLFYRHLISPEMHDRPGRLFSSSIPLGECLNSNLAPDQAFGPGNFFDDIGFCDSLKNIIDEARRVELGENYAAIHVRSGDCVYADWRTYFGHPSQGRVVPIPLLKMVIERLKSQNRFIILFGEDLKVLNRISQAYEVKVSADYWPRIDLSPHQQAMFDLILMSRARHIYSPRNSAFSQLAQVISRTAERHDVLKMFSAEEAASFFIKDLDLNAATYPNLQNAVSYGYLHHIARGIRGFEERISYLEAASRYDQESPVYIIHKALEYYAARRPEAGEKVLAEGFKMTADGGQSGFSFQNPGLDLKRCLPLFAAELEKIAQDSYPFVRYLLSAAYDQCRNPDKASFWGQKALDAYQAKIADRLVN